MPSPPLQSMPVRRMVHPRCVPPGGEERRREERTDLHYERREEPAAALMLERREEELSGCTELSLRAEL